MLAKAEMLLVFALREKITLGSISKGDGKSEHQQFRNQRTKMGWNQ